jgi:hypothetical protein
MVTTAMILSAIGSRTSGPMADLLFATAIVMILGLFWLGFIGPMLAEGLAHHARPVDAALRSVFPRLRHWSWPLALAITMVLGISGVVFQAWWHAPPDRTRHMAHGDLQWLLDSANRNERPH